MFFMNFNAVIPEFMVSNRASPVPSTVIYWFTIEYGRPEENFLFLSLEDANDRGGE